MASNFYSRSTYSYPNFLKLLLSEPNGWFGANLSNSFFALYDIPDIFSRPLKPIVYAIIYSCSFVDLPFMNAFLSNIYAKIQPTLHISTAAS